MEQNITRKQFLLIRCAFSFNFTGTNGFDQYTAKVYIYSQREIYRQNKNDPIDYTLTFKYLDERCTFDYSRSMQFVKNDVIFNSYLSLLDYYSYLIVGFDEDSYFPKGGSKYFQKAMDICNKPIVGDAKNGWAETGGGAQGLTTADSSGITKFQLWRLSEMVISNTSGQDWIH